MHYSCQVKGKSCRQLIFIIKTITSWLFLLFMLFKKQMYVCDKNSKILEDVVKEFGIHFQEAIEKAIQIAPLFALSFFSEKTTRI